MAQTKPTDRANLIQSGALALCVLGVSAMSLLLFTRSAAQAGGPGAPIIVENVKYLGNATCAAKECHGADKSKPQSGQNIGDEASLWSSSDPHAKAFKTLGKDPSKAIAAKLTIADAAKSERCISCHAMNVKSDKRGELFALEDAVGCESCHGPAEKWNDPHKKEGWTMAERAKLRTDGLFKTYSLVDTAYLPTRAQVCVACHLQIDKDLIDAGHPPLEFELYAYSYYVSKNPKAEYKPHWDEPPKDAKMRDARLWAIGQFAAADAAAGQVDAWKKKSWDPATAEAMAKLYADGAAIAKKHFGADNAEKMNDAPIAGDKAAAAMADLAAFAPAAKDSSSRRVIVYGLGALGSSVFEGLKKDAPDDFWKAYDAAKAALDKGGDAYTAAVKKMVDLAK